MTSNAFFLVLTLAFALSACDAPQAAPGAQTPSGDAAALPKPEQAASGVTGMPAQPGPGDVPLAGAAPVAETPDDAMPVVDPSTVDPSNPETGMLPGAPEPAPPGDATAAPREPDAQDAVAVIRDYYASIDNRSYARAYALWSDGGRASRQTPEQFAAGFASTAHVRVDTGTPGAEDAGAGQRYIQIPVAISATQRDGSLRRYDGSYTLHRTVVDGADADQRAWRIASADLRELAR